MNQNLFRAVRVRVQQFVRTTGFRSTAVDLSRGRTLHRSRTCSSNDVGARLEFTRGRPWGKTAFITGYTRRNLTFSPGDQSVLHDIHLRGHCSASSAQKLTVTALGEYIRSFRVQDTLTATAQALRPGGTVAVQAQQLLERRR